MLYVHQVDIGGIQELYLNRASAVSFGEKWETNCHTVTPELSISVRKRWCD
jgi:hypothetical protein